MKPEPVFIFGMTARTGTTYLQRLLCLHPGCERFALPEDFLFQHSDPLVQYADRMRDEYRTWTPHWRLQPEAFPEMDHLLRRSLGDGLVRFIGSLSGNRRPVVKTPSVAGVSNFLKLCPERRCVLLVRDGRSVAESLIHSGLPRQDGKQLAWCAKAWDWAASEVLRLRSEPGFSQVLVVRFEDLTSKTREELIRILGFLGLPIASYPMWDALNLKVSGSSFLGDPKNRWEEVEKPADFRPENRFSHWDGKRHAVFNEIAGPRLTDLGYCVL